MDERGIRNETSDSVGALTRSGFNSSLLIDVFEQQHMDKWARDKILGRRNARLKAHRSDPSLTRKERFGKAHLHNSPSDNVEWAAKRLRKTASEAMNVECPQWIPLQKLVMDRYKSQMDKLLDIATNKHP